MTKRLPVTELHERVQKYLKSLSVPYDIISYGPKHEKSWAYSFFDSRVQILINSVGGSDGADYVDLKDENYDEVLRWFEQRLRLHSVIS